MLPVAPDPRKTVPAGTAIPIVGQIRVAPGRRRVDRPEGLVGRLASIRDVSTSADGGFSTVLRPKETVQLPRAVDGTLAVRSSEARLSAPFTLRVLGSG